MMRSALLSFAMVLVAALPARADDAPYIREVLDDGSTLLFARTPGSRVASFRLVIRAGGSSDPDGKAGLAHLLEHLIFHGTYEIEEGAIFHAVHKAGGTLNAFTSADMTTYVLDAPKDHFLSLMETYATMVTSPALPLSKLDRERGVVDAEHMERNVGNLLFALDQQIFPSRNRGQTVIGTRDSRADILADDIRTFYEEHYLAMNAAIVVTGDFTLDEVKSVLARGLKWPPRVQPKPAEEPASPNVPSQTKALSWVTATAAAYLADGMDRQVCDAIGALIDMRLRRKLLVEESGASWTTVFCHENRGHKFLVSLAFTTTSAGNQLPTVMKALFADARRAPPTVAEKALLESHGKAIFGLMLARAPTLADALAKGAASANQSIEKGVEAELMPPRFDWPSMQQALTTSITEQNFVLIHFSPYEES